MFRKIIIDNNGQTCNRFWGYLDSVAWAILNRKKVVILYWDSNIKFFNRLRHSPYVTFPFYFEWLVRRVGDKKAQKLVYWLYDNVFFHWFFANVRSFFGIIQILRGWDTRNNTDNHLKVGRFAYDQFLPNNDIISTVIDVFSKQRLESCVIVGVHIRKGDYEDWLDGKYFYEDEVYERFLSQMEQLLAPRRVKFFISTNGKISDILMCSHDIFYINNGNMAHDLYGLSQCDFIMGPPSTFSKWASLVGSVPLNHIYTPNERLSLDDFSSSSALAPWTL
ncbi:MAG: alpha-1,2-fucosyltransferase [Prevotella sp.]|nr:alpha-1,2-fucosyltransferase [Prevotella sp.]